MRCALQHVGEASVGHSWTMEDKSMTPKVSKLVEMFIAPTGTCVPLRMVRECWPSSQENTPQQDLQGVCGTIVRRLDEVATHQPFTDSVGLICFRTSGGGTLERRMLILLPGQGHKHRGMDAQNQTHSSKCGGALWLLHMCPDV